MRRDDSPVILMIPIFSFYNYNLLKFDKSKKARIPLQKKAVVATQQWFETSLRGLKTRHVYKTMASARKSQISVLE